MSRTECTVLAFAERTRSILNVDPSFRVIPLSNKKPKEPLEGLLWKKEARRDNFPASWDECTSYGVFAPAGILVIDVDPVKDENGVVIKTAEEVLIGLRRVPGWSENTYTVKTPRGWHFYWKCDKLPDKQYGGDSGLGLGVDTRNAGKGYTIGPESVIDGEEYVVLTDLPIAKIPGRLFDALVREPVDIEFKETKGNNGAAKGRNGSTSRTEELFAAAAGIREGQRNNVLASFAGSLVNSGISDEEVESVLQKLNQRQCKNNPLEEGEVSAVARSMLTRRERGPHIKYDQFTVEDGRSDGEKLRHALTGMQVAVRWNIRHAAVEWKRHQDEDWIIIEDGDEFALSYRIEEHCVTFPKVRHWKKKPPSISLKPLKFSPANFRRALFENAWQTQVDPFILYLEGLPKWDGQPRIDDLLSFFFKSDSPKALQAWGMWGVIGGAIRRAYEPGAKHDEMPILVGAQGIGKSTFWLLLLPDEDWFSDNLNLGDNAQQRIESLMGNVIVECSELQGIARTELSSLKAFMSRSTDKLRRAYAHYPAGIRRRTIIVGSTNQEDCLPADPTGNRRFVPIRVEGSLSVPDKIRAELPGIRDQMWAEGLVRYKKGEASHLPTGLKKILSEQSEQHESSDEVLVDLLKDALQRIEHFGDNDNYTRLADVAKALDMQMPVPMRTQRKLTQGLKNLGYQRLNHPKRGRLWVTQNPPKKRDLPF